MADFLRILDTEMETPQPYGWFHLLFLALSILASVGLCLWHKRSGTEKRVRQVVFFTALLVIVLEIYKLVNFSFDYENGITFDFAWYAFPWQFCSTPMFVGALTGIFRKGKIHQALCSYLATFAMFAGICVMLSPTTAFISTVGINIQTMVCHGSMITVGIYLLYSGYVKAEQKTLLRALPVFITAVLIAMVLNEIAYRSGLLETDGFNMFYISPHQEPHLPVYSLIQPILPYPVCVMLYICAFTLASELILLLAMAAKKLVAPLKKVG